MGYINGHEECRQTVITPEKAVKLEVSYFEKGKPATTNDILIVYVNIVDRNGTLCVSDSSKISLSVEKGGEIVGPDNYVAEAGIASFLIRTNEDDELIIKAKSSFAEAVKTLPLVR